MNEENNSVPTPNVEQEEMKMPKNFDYSSPNESSPSVINGPILLILALLLAGILGGMYYWFATMESNSNDTNPPQVTRPSAEENNEPESTTAEAQVDAILTTSPSDEISAIEADLEATNLDGLDAELEAIDAELEAGIQ